MKNILINESSIYNIEFSIQVLKQLIGKNLKRIKINNSKAGQQEFYFSSDDGNSEDYQCKDDFILTTNCLTKLLNWKRLVLRNYDVQTFRDPYYRNERVRLKKLDNNYIKKFEEQLLSFGDAFLVINVACDNAGRIIITFKNHNFKLHISPDYFLSRKVPHQWIFESGILGTPTIVCGNR